MKTLLGMLLTSSFFFAVASAAHAGCYYGG